MARNQSQAGFTLIELVLALTISAALIPIVLNGQREIRSRAQFSDGVERLRNDLVNIKNEANTTVSTRQIAPGTDSRYAVAGKVVILDNTGSSGALRLTIRTLRFDESVSPLQLSFDPDPTATTTQDIPWGVRIDPAVPVPLPQIVVYLRNDDTGHLQTYFPASIVATTTYASYVQAGVAKTINLIDPDNHKGTVVVDPIFGNVTRTIQ